jgi:hypothetical protein
MGEGWKHTSPTPHKTPKPSEKDTLQQPLPFWFKEFPPLEKSSIVLTLPSDVSVSRRNIINLLSEKLASLPDEEREETVEDLLKKKDYENDCLHEAPNLNFKTERTPPLFILLSYARQVFIYKKP